MDRVGCCALVLLVAAASAAKIPPWHIKVAHEQGPNACVVAEVPGTNRRIYTECKYWRNRDICGQKAVIKYECCEGFHQVPGQKGCAGVKPLQGVLETARSLGASRFVQLIEDSGLAQELRAAAAVTLFAPSDDAFEALPRHKKDQLLGLNPEVLSPFLLYHLVDRRLTSHHFKADIAVETRYVGRSLRINKFASGVETVNCATIVRKDQEATNGVVHILDTVLDPDFIQDRDFAQIILQDGRFSELAKAMERSSFVNQLRKAHQPCTVLAPSDEAFQKIPSSRLQRILEDREAREAMLANHVIPHPVCLSALMGESRVRTLGEGRLTLDCDRRGAIVDGKRLRADFTMAANGVIYMLDDLLLPNRARSLLELVEEEKLTTFRQAVITAGLEDTLDNYGEYTLFVPSEETMQGIPLEQLRELKTDKQKAKEFVLYHAAQGRIRSDTIADNQVVMSLDEQHPLRLQVYRKAFGVEDALIQKADVEGMNGCIHVINKVLSPPQSSAGDILRQNGNFSIFLHAMERVMETSPDILQLNGSGSSYTFFVPTDQAFSRLGAARLERIMDDMPYLSRTIRNHVVENMISSEAFQSDLYYDVQTKQRMVDVVRKNGKLKVNDATMVNCDIVNTNGVIHVINKVLLPDG